jgi:hypothetical protein
MTQDVPLYEAPESVELHEDSQHGRLFTFLSILKRLTMIALGIDLSGSLELGILPLSDFPFQPSW